MAYIPIIPPSRGNIIINKTIVYSDTVLPLNDKGNNLKVTSISNVENNQLERCLETVFNNNSNITFNTIQYSRNDKKVYFYTDKEINTKCWNEVNTKKYDYIDSSNILEVIDDVLNQPLNMDNSLASAYLVSKLGREIYEEYRRKEQFYEDKLNDVLKRKIYADARAYVNSYHNGNLDIGFKKFYGGKYENIVFSRKNNDIYIVSSESYYDKDVLRAAHDVIDTIFDYYENKDKYDVLCKSVNSPLWVNIDYRATSIHDDRYSIASKFVVRNEYYGDGVKIECNSSKILEKLKEKENELLKKVFVKISECPEILQKPLQELRQKEIIYNLKEQEKEFRKQQRKEKIEKIFPFIKKR